MFPPHRSSIKVAVICERSGTVREAFRNLGFDAHSFDIEPDDYDSPYHHQGDALLVDYSPYALGIAHPPCTDIAISGARHFRKKGPTRILRGATFAFKMWNLPIPLLALENPRSLITHWRKPDQEIQPYWFGDRAQKATCLWLRGLPRLEPSNIVDKGEMWIGPTGKVVPAWYALAKGDRGRVRSVTFPGIAYAMAYQWGAYLDYLYKKD